MHKRSEFTLATISREGVLFPPSFLHRIAERDSSLEGLSAEAYHLTGEKLNEAINRSWMRLLQKWQILNKSSRPDNRGTIKEFWVYPLFIELGYGRLLTAKPFEKDGKKYPISHSWGHVPIHIVSGQTRLDESLSKRRGHTTRQSAYLLVQELLNRSDECLWGMATNGLRLRLLRRNRRLTHQTYIEFNLEAMMQGEVYAEFALFWFLCHQSRFESEHAADCWLERWSTIAHEYNIRALDKLRSGVQKAVCFLGQGFLECRSNQLLRDKLRLGTLSVKVYYRQLLRLIYRLIVLFVAEDRGLLLIPDADKRAKERYTRYYSTARLRSLAASCYGSRHTDIFQGLRLVMQRLSEDPGCPELALPALDGFLFERGAMTDLDNCDITNARLLEAVRSLAFLAQENGLRPVDYQHIGSEELGSVYEALLEFHPVVESESRRFSLQVSPGNERKISGSYYTPRGLVEHLLDSALEPALTEACQQPDPVKAILSLKICDPACGSGHFLIATAQRMAYRLAFERAGKVEPERETWRQAMRDVIRNCIYGVDSNSMAVELCKVSLCIEAIEPGKPLVFLDHHIRCGNSLIGTTPELLRQGIPNSAFVPLEGDVPQLCRIYQQRNREGQAGQWHLLIEPMEHIIDQLEVLRIHDDKSYQDILEIKQGHQKALAQQEYKNNLLIANAWCAAFFWHKVYIDSQSLAYPFTQGILRELIENRSTYRGMRREIESLAEQYQFFHWHLAFPDVFKMPKKGEMPENGQTGWSGGFDVVLGNPPWESNELKEKEWFASRNPTIAYAENAAQRSVMIKSLADKDPKLYREFLDEKRKYQGKSNFIRHSGLYPLCGRGKINTYSVFTECMRQIINPKGRIGCIVPSGIATDDTTKVFFQDLINSHCLVGLYDFENASGIFSSIHRSYKFCLLTLTSPLQLIKQSSQFAFFLHSIADLQEIGRSFALSAHDIRLINPNTRTCPIFRSQRDAELTRLIYEHVPILVKEGGPEQNPWQVKLSTMFNMAADSHLFHTRGQLEADGWLLEGNIFQHSGEQSFPLYEGKMISFYDHRFGGYEETSQDNMVGNGAQFRNPSHLSQPRYWVRETEMPSTLLHRRNALLAFRDVARSTDIRTAIFSIIPPVPCNDKLPLVLLTPTDICNMVWITTCFSSLIFDYVARQKLGGTSLSFFILKQLPVLSPRRYDAICPWDCGYTLGSWILPRALELIYTAWDLAAFAKDCSYNGSPFRWDEERRFLLRCELDAGYFHLYSIARNDVDYIMETFPILKRKDEKQYGEYRTKRVILEVYDELQKAMETGVPYQTWLNPLPADHSTAYIIY